MATQINYTEQVNHYKKKRNLFLFFIISPIVIVGLLYLINLNLRVIAMPVMDTLILILALLFLFYISYLKSRLSVVTMYYEYYRILADEVGIQSNISPLILDDLPKKLLSSGYALKQSQDKFSVYQLVKVDNKSYYNKKGTVVVAVILHQSIDFFDPSIFQSIETIYNQLEKNNIHVLNQVTLIFKKYETLDQTSLEELQKIVNVKQGYRSLIQLNIGFDTNKNAYYLAPKKRFPNRMYYETDHEVKKILKLNEG